MRKNFTYLFVATLFFTSTLLNGQIQVWPTADTNTVKASQFADTTLIFQKTAAKPTPPAGYTGWVSVGTKPNDAVLLDITHWGWSRTSVSRGGYGGNAPLISSSIANGAAIFDSDFLDNGGVQGAVGKSPSPHAAELISPTMNATGYSDMIIEFNQLYRAFASKCFIRYSNDDGATWSKDFQLNAEVAPNASSPNTSVTTTKKRVILYGSQGTNKFKIKFIFDGDYYFWAIDDVKLISQKYFDVQINTDFYAITPSVYTPVNQLDTVRFLSDVSNQGTNAMNNVKLKVTVWRDADKAIVYTSTSSQYPTVTNAGDTIQNRILPNPLLPAAISTPGKYFGSYRVFGDSSIVDVVPTNDTARFEFWVSDTSATNSVVIAGVGKSNYTKEDANTTTTRLGNGFWTGTEPRSVRYGNYYRINKVPATITTLTARLNPFPAAGRAIQGNLYEWKDANDDGIIQYTERTIVAASDTIIPKTVANANAWFVFKLSDINTGKLFNPKANTDYIAVVEFDAPAFVAAKGDTNYISMVFNSGFYNNFAMRYVMDSIGSPRYATILGKNIDSDWTTTGFSNRSLTPVVRLNVLPFVITNTTTVLSENNKMTLSPNPVGSDNVVNIDIELEKYSDALFRVYNLDGRLLTEQVLEKFQKQNVQLEVNEYSAGTYIVQILTPDGVMSKRFVKAN
jgi:Secretion system C-terminal sorting domain